MENGKSTNFGWRAPAKTARRSAKRRTFLTAAPAGDKKWARLANQWRRPDLRGHGLEQKGQTGRVIVGHVTTETRNLWIEGSSGRRANTNQCDGWVERLILFPDRFLTVMRRA